MNKYGAEPPDEWSAHGAVIKLDLSQPREETHWSLVKDGESHPIHQTVNPAIRLVHPAAKPMAQPAPQPATQPAAPVEPRPQRAAAETPAAPQASRPAEAQPVEQILPRRAEQGVAEEAVQPAAKPAEQRAVQPVEKQAVQPAAKPAEQIAVQPVEKQAVQPAAKPAEQRAGQPVEKQPVQPAAKPAEQRALQPVEKQAVQPAAKPEEQRAVQPVEKQAAAQPGGETVSCPEGTTWCPKCGKCLEEPCQSKAMAATADTQEASQGAATAPAQRNETAGIRLRGTRAAEQPAPAAPTQQSLPPSKLAPAQPLVEPSAERAVRHAADVQRLESSGFRLRAVQSPKGDVPLALQVKKPATNSSSVRSPAPQRLRPVREGSSNATAS